MIQTPKFFTAQAGMSLIEVVIGVAVFSGLALVTATVMNSLTVYTKRSNFRLTMESLRDTYIGMLKQDAWTKTPGKNPWDYTINDLTVNNTATFACLRAGPCLSTVAQAFTPFDADKRPYEDYRPVGKPGPTGGVATHGFAVDGSRCNTYPSAICPIRINFTWAPVCVVPCTNPEIDINMTFTIAPAPAGQNFGGTLSMDRFNTHIHRNGVGATGANQQAVVGTSCGANQVTIGFDASGLPRCQNGASAR